MASQRVKGISIEIDGSTTKLQNALKDVDKSLSTTQKSLKDVEKLLKFDPKNTELLAQKQQLLKKAVEDTKTRLDKLKEAQKQMDANGVDKNSEQYQALQREIIATEGDLKKFNAQLKELEDLGKRSGISLEQIGAGAKKLSDNTRALSASAAAAGTAMLGMAYNAGKNADDLLTMSRNTGISVEELQKMQYASDLVDVSMDQMTGSLSKLVKQMGSGNKAFETLGVAITDENGNMRDATDVWYESLEALSKIENGTERDQIAMELFGKSAMDLSGIVDDGGEALKAFGQEAEDMGLVLSEDAVASAAAFNDEMDKLKNQATQAFFEAGAALADTLLPMLGDLIAKVSEVIVWFSDLDGNTQILILSVLGLVAAISPVAGLISGIVTVMGALSGAFTFFLSPAGLVVAAIAAVIAIGVALWQNWDVVKQKLSDLWSAFQEKWNNIKTTVSTVVGNIVTTVTTKFENVKKTISDAIEGARSAVSTAINAIKKLFDFNITWPHIPLPHFSVSGSANPLDWLKNGVPKISISWYAKAMDNGMILNSPTIFGMQNGRLLGGGEAGSEVVVGANSLYSMIQSAVGSRGVTAPITLNVTVNGNVDDSDRFARQLGDRLATLINRNSEVFR